jgi:hypothetical protein
MAILRSSHKVVEAESQPKSQPKSFKELVSRIGQRSQLAAPKYADSTKLVTKFVWDRWTQYVYDHIYRLFITSWTALPWPARPLSFPTASATASPRRPRLFSLDRVCLVFLTGPAGHTRGLVPCFTDSPRTTMPTASMRDCDFANLSGIDNRFLWSDWTPPACSLSFPSFG